MEKVINDMIKDEAVQTASKKIRNLKKEVNEEKDVHIDILKDALEDARQERKFIKRITFILLIAVFCFIGAFVGLYLYSSHQLIEVNNAIMDFLDSCDMYSVEQSMDYSGGDVYDNNISVK